MFKHFVGLVAATSLALFAMPSFAVKTFDCKKSTQPLLQAICNDDRLSIMDDEMATVYLELKKTIEDRATAEDKERLIKDLRQEQNDWMTKVMAPCVNSAQSIQCVRNAYSQRNEKLNQQLGQIIQVKTGSSGVIEYKPRETKVVGTAAQSSQATASPGKNITTITGKIAAGGSEANGSITPDKGKRVTFLDDSPLADKIYDKCKVYDICEVSGETKNGHLISISSVNLVKKHESKEQDLEPSFEVKTFECKHAAGMLKTVCHNEKLATLDVQLSEAYDEHAKIFNYLNEVERNRLSNLLKQDHLDWRRDVLLKCKTAKCAEDAYIHRNDEMYKMAGRLEMQIQEAKTGSGAGGTKSLQTAAQPSQFEIRVKYTQKSITETQYGAINNNNDIDYLVKGDDIKVAVVEYAKNLDRKGKEFLIKDIEKVAFVEGPAGKITKAGNLSMRNLTASHFVVIFDKNNRKIPLDFDKKDDLLKIVNYFNRLNIKVEGN
jgi:uncharacterized protein